MSSSNYLGQEVLGKFLAVRPSSDRFQQLFRFHNGNFVFGEDFNGDVFGKRLRKVWRESRELGLHFGFR